MTGRRKEGVKSGHSDQAGRGKEGVKSGHSDQAGGGSDSVRLEPSGRKQVRGQLIFL